MMNCLIEGHILYEDMPYWKACLIESHVFDEGMSCR